MSSSKSSRRRLEGTVKVKLNRSAKESSANGTDNSEEETIKLNDSGSEDGAAVVPKTVRKESGTLNKSVLALSDDLRKLIDRVTCCSCGKQLNVMNAGAVRKHPWLKVVTCKKCYKFLRSGPFTRDDDGTDEQCRWCGDGGRLYGCDYCHNCFCRSCIKRNLGRTEATKMEEDDGSKWHCYMCKPKKIRGLVKDCDKILDYIAMEDKKEKEAEERRAKREKEKAANAVKVKEEKKQSRDTEKKGDKGSAKKGFPAPKDKSEVAVQIKPEKKEEKTDTSNGKKDGAPDLIVLDDSPLKISQHHRARAYKPDLTTGVKQVQKATNGVLEVTVGPKNSKPIVNVQGKQPGFTNNRPLLAGILGQNVVGSGLNRGLGKRLPPPNDLQVLKNNILPLNIDAAIDKLMPMTQSFNLSLNSAKTDLAIAKLSQVNMYQARQRACSQIRNSIEYYLNSMREVWGVQLVANSNTAAAEGTGDPGASLLKAAMGMTNTDPNVTSTPIKSKESQPAPKLDESVIPIEIDSPTPAKEVNEEVMEVDDKDSDSVVCIDKPEKEAEINKNDEPVENNKSKEPAEKDKSEEPAEKDKSEEPDSGGDDMKSSETVDKVNGDDSVTEVSDAEFDNESEEDVSKKDKVVKNKKDSDTSETKKDSLNEKDTNKNDEIDEDNSGNETKLLKKPEKKSETNTENSGKDSKMSKKPEKKSENEDKSDDGEESGAEEDNQVSENTAAELELLKEMADELNEKEDSDEDEEEAQPRRSSRSRKVVESENKDDEDKDSPVRRSSRQKTKPEEKSDAKSDKTGDQTKTERQSRRSRTTESDKTKEKSLDKTKDVSEEENVSADEEQGKTKSKRSKDKSRSKGVNDEDVKTKSNKSKDKTKDASEEETEEEQVKSKSKKGSDSHKKSDKKSKVVYDSDDDTVEEEKEEKTKSKRSDKAKADKVKNKHDKSQDSGEDSEEESTSKTKTKGKDKDSKSSNKSKESKRKPSKEVEDDDDSTEVEGEKAEEQTKKKSSAKDKKKSPSKKKEEEDGIGVDDNIPTEESDTSDSSDESFEEFGKRKTRRMREKKEKTEETKGTRSSSRRATRQRGKKSTEEEASDSDPDFDKDLEKEIKSLSKETRLSRKKKSEKESKKESKQTKDDKKGKDKKKSAKQEVSAEDEEEGSDLSSTVEMPSDDPEDSEDDTDNLSASQLKKLKQAGKAALEASDDDDDIIPENISSDSSDPEVSFPKLSTPKKGKKHAMDENSDDSDFITPKKNKRIRSKLLDTKITDSESDTGKKGKKGKKGKRKRKGNSDDFSELSDEEENRQKGKGKKRRRIKKMASSDEEKVKEPGEDDEVSGSEEDENTPGGHLKRKQIRKVIGTGKLKDATKAAQKAEEMRRKRIEERQKEYNTYVEVEGGEEEEDAELPEGTEREHATPVKTTDSIAKILGSPRKVPVTTKCVLEMDKEKKKTLVEVDRTLVRKLKPHQVEAVRFMYNCCIETIENKDKGSGCILAHCMGLGKTLSVITFVHTVLSHVKLTKMTKCLVVCPLNTVLNWVNEFEIWLDDVDFEIEVYEMSRVKQNFERAQMLKEWSEGGAGVLILGYDMYRNLVGGTHCRNAKQKKIFYQTLADPGPDITICDEGHILKNDQTSLSKAMMKIKSAKRVVLTGTPLQNNLGEYHCMVNFVKPSLLGTRKEFNNRFNNPITNGQCKDSTAFDVKLMKRRAHILHELLAGCVQRKDYSALTKFLPPKFEYVISVRLAPVQMSLYEKYLEMTMGSGADVQSKGARLFRDYQALMRIWTHPWVLKLDEIRQENKRQFDDTESEDSFVDDGSGSDSFIENSTSSSASESEEGESSATGKKKNKRKTRGGRGKASSSSDEDSKKENPDEVVKKWTSKRRGNEEGAGSSWMEDMGYGGLASVKDDNVTSEWWAEYVKEDDASKLDISGKLMLLFEILKMCEDIGDKVLVFSQSLLSLDIIEDFLMKVEEAQNFESTEDDKPSTSGEKDKPSTSGEKDKSSTSGEKDKSDSADKTDATSKSDEASADGEEKKEKTEKEKNQEKLARYGKNWTKGADYFRMDGSTNSQNRKTSQDMFNDPENYRARLFLISTKAGSLGINLVSANRVIIFDASWNPSHDIQSIFRVYRFGQVKPVYVYRFLAQGTMEEKIYERQVTKQSLSQRVVDEHQIARHFTSHDLQELYKFQPDRLDDPEKKDRPLPMLPKDHMLAELMTTNSEWVVTYHEHDSLLENVIEQELNEEEKKAAWEDYENEKKGLNRVQQMMGGAGLNPAVYATQQMSMQNLLLQGQANLGQAAVLQIVQDLKARFPNLPPEVFQQRVQAVLRQVLTQQIMQQSAMQRQQVEQHRLNELNRLNQMKQQIQRQQAMINGPQNMYSVGQQSLLSASLSSGNMSGLRPQTLNQLSINRSNAPIDLTGQSSSTNKK